MKTNKSVQSGLALFISILSLISISYTTVRILRNSDSGTDMQQNQSSSLTHSDFRDVKEQISPVCQDTVISRDYVIRNLGNDTLNVLFVSPDCNCTGYKLSSPAVLPGDSIILSMDIDMHHKRIGKFMINTILALNTEKRLYRIKIEGEVSTFHDMPSGREDRLIPEPNEENTAQAGQTEVSLSADVLELGNVSLSKPVTSSVVIKNAGKNMLSVRGVVTSCECVTAEISSKEILPGETAELQITFRPEEKGEFFREVNVFCNVEGSPLEISLHGVAK